MNPQGAWVMRYYYNENNNRRDFGEIWKDKEIEYGMKKIIKKIYIYILLEIIIKFLRMKWWNREMRAMESKMTKEW